jgi:hypothetical protein
MATENTDKRSRHEGNMDSLPDVARMSDFRSKRREGGSKRGNLCGSCLLPLVLFLRICRGLL